MKTDAAWQQPAAAAEKSPETAGGKDSIEESGWALIAPFGEHPKTRVYAEEGRVKEQKFIQVLDEESAAALVSGENSFFRKLKRALVGIPVFKGHGDLVEHDRQALAGGTPRVKVGVVDKIRRGARGVEGHFALDPEGAAAVAAGWKLPSALWLVRPMGEEILPGGEKVVRARPFKLLSVALTPFPNISGVEALANQRDQRDAGPKLPEGLNNPNRKAGDSTTTTNQETIMKELIIGWLAGQGMALANDATDGAVLAAFQQALLARDASLAALDNEKNALNATVAALTAERDAQTQRAGEAAAALGNAQSGRQAERRGRAELAADLAIQRGKKTVAEREALVAALENSAQFEVDIQGLLSGKSVVKTAADAVSGKQHAGLSSEEAQLRREYAEAFQGELIATGQDAVRAHQQIMRLPKYAGLAARLAPKKF